MLELLVKTIVINDKIRLKELIGENPQSVFLKFGKDILFDKPNIHWIYKNDTLLHAAAAFYRFEIVRILVESGVEVNSAFNRRAARPLHYAADGIPGNEEWNEEDQIETIKILLDSGAELNAQDKNGTTPLHRAVRARCSQAVRLLIEKGANPLIKNKSGSNPFHLAVQNTGRGGTGKDESVSRQKQIIRQFLELGIDQKIKDGKGKTVSELAVNEEIKNLLEVSA